MKKQPVSDTVTVTVCIRTVKKRKDTSLSSFRVGGDSPVRVRNTVELFAFDATSVNEGQRARRLSNSVGRHIQLLSKILALGQVHHYRAFKAPYFLTDI